MKCFVKREEVLATAPHSHLPYEVKVFPFSPTGFPHDYNFEEDCPGPISDSGFSGGIALLRSRLAARGDAEQEPCRAGCGGAAGIDSRARRRHDRCTGRLERPRVFGWRPPS